MEIDFSFVVLQSIFTFTHYYYYFAKVGYIRVLGFLEVGRGGSFCSFPLSLSLVLFCFCFCFTKFICMISDRGCRYWDSTVQYFVSHPFYRAMTL